MSRPLPDSTRTTADIAQPSQPDDGGDSPIAPFLAIRHQALGERRYPFRPNGGPSPIAICKPMRPFP